MASANVPLAFNNKVLNEFSSKLPQGGKWIVKRVSSNQRIRLSVGYKDKQAVIHSAPDLDQFIQDNGVEISSGEKRQVQTVINELGELFNNQPPPTPPPKSRAGSSPASRSSAKTKSKTQRRTPAAAAPKPASKQKAVKQQQKAKAGTKATTKAPAKTAKQKGQTSTVATTQVHVATRPVAEAKPEVKRKRSRPINAVAKDNPQDISKSNSARGTKNTSSSANARSKNVADGVRNSTQPNKKRKPTTVNIATRFATGDEDDAILPGREGSRTTADEDAGSSDFDDDPNDAIAAFAASALALQRNRNDNSVLSSELKAPNAAGEEVDAKKRKRTSKGSMSITQLAKTSDTYEPLLRHFEGANKGARGIKTALRKHANRGSLVPAAADLENFAKQEAVAHATHNFFHEQYSQRSEEWLWLLHCGYNILLYGAGDKSGVITSFATEALVGEDVIEITHRNSNGDPRSLLDFIATHILRRCSDFRTSNLLQYAKQVAIALGRLYNTESSWFPSLSFQPPAVDSVGDGSVTDSTSEPTLEGDSIWLMPTRKTRSHHRLAEIAAADDTIKSKPDSRKLFLLLHDLSTPAWQSQESQLILSTLASGRSVGIVAAFEHVNLPSQWTHRMLDQFRWVFQHVPTYKHLQTSLRATSADITGGMHQQGLEYVLRSLTRRHLEILGVLSDHQLVADGAVAMSYAALFEACKKQIITQTDAQLRHFLVELRDQKLIVMSHGKDGKELVKIPLQIDSLQRIKTIVAR